MLDLLAAHVKVGMLSFSSSAQHVKDGKLVALAAAPPSGCLRSRIADVEGNLGTDFLVDDLVFAVGPGWNAGGHRRTHQPRGDQGERPAEVRKQIDIHTIESKAMTPAEFTAFIVNERDRWTPIIKKIMREKPQENFRRWTQ